MIYLLDSFDDYHAYTSLSILGSAENKLIEVSKLDTIDKIGKIIQELIASVRPNDIVLCPWAVPGNYYLDSIFEDLAEICWVVVAAGNSGQDIENWTPARVRNVITVGALNKTGNQASMSNYSHLKQIEWVPGTNILVNGKFCSGTSISACIYASYLLESINRHDMSLLDRNIEDLKLRLLAEISEKDTA